MATKGNTSEVGEDSPTEESKQELDNLVDDVLAPRATSDNLEEAKEPDLEETNEEPQSEQTEEPSEEAEEPTEETEEDEVVPASKHKKALEKMQKRIDQLTAEREAARIKEQSKAKTSEEKLAALSVDDLAELKENTDEAIIDLKVSAKVEGADVTDRLNELKALKKTIDKTIKEAPARFQAKQAEHLKQMAEAVKEVDPQVTEHKGDLWNMAARIYSRTPSMQRSETGQAEALALAAEYMVEKQNVDGSREKASTLSKKVANLKRKTALDGKTRMANSEQTATKSIREKAIKGDYYDKLAFVEKLVPDNFLQT